jgi:hypothetical protein
VQLDGRHRTLRMSHVSGTRPQKYEGEKRHPHVRIYTDPILSKNEVLQRTIDAL